MKMRRQRAGDSYIVRFFAFLTHFVYHTLGIGFLGRVFTSYTATDRAFRNSLAGRVIHSRDRRNGKLYRAMRRNLALAMSQSAIVRGVSFLVRGLCRCSLRTIGLFLLTSGSYSAVMYWLFSVIWQRNGVGVLNLYCGIAMLILGILLLFSDVSLGYALQRGMFFGKILVGVFGVSDDALRDVEREGKQGYVVAVPLGMVLGALCALISPVYLIVACAAILLALLILSIPEAGVVLLILFLPFVGLLPNGDLWLLLAVAVPIVSYFGKLLRGNRAIHLEIQDVPVLLMLLLFLLSGVSVAGRGAWRGALLCTILAGAYFLVVNVIATPRWTERCRGALIASATLAALFSIVQFISAAVATTEFSLVALSLSVRAGFADRTTLAYFLVLSFPFVLGAFVRVRLRHRLLTGFAMVSVISATVLTCVQSAWLALGVILVVFLLLYRKRSFPFVLVGGALAPAAVSVLPVQVRGSILEFLRADPTAESVHRAQGIVSRLLFGNVSGIFGYGTGISRVLFGLGHGGIEQLVMLYTASMPTVVSGSLNFWFYRLLEGGVLGVLAPAAFFFLLLQNCFSLLRTATGRSARIAAIAGVTAVVGVLTMSLFRYAWYDPAALLAFFLATALIAANARYQRAGTVMAEEKMQDDNAVEMEYYGRA